MPRKGETLFNTYLNRAANLFTPILAGLFFAQLIGTLQVYLSNHKLSMEMSAVIGSGYIPVPNTNITRHLDSIIPALCGGLFFTLSIGIFLTFVSIISARIWIRIQYGNAGRSKVFSGILVIIWCLILLLVNIDGIIWIPSLYFLIIPPMVFALKARTLKNRTPQNIGTKLFTSFISLFLLAVILIGIRQSPADWYKSFSEKLLLTSSIGNHVLEFYYNNTLYPAHSFNSLTLKLIKTYRLEIDRIGLNSRDSINPDSLKQISGILIKYDYLPITNGHDVDLEIRISGTQMDMLHNGRHIMTSPVIDFLKTPRTVLNKFSQQTDYFSLFRLWLLVSLICIPFISIYAFIYIPVNAIAGKLLINPWHHAIVPSTVFFLIFSCLILFLMPEDRRQVEPDIIKNYFTSRDISKRLEALHAAVEGHIDLAETPSYKKLLNSPHLVERYWLAKTLGHMKSRETYEELLRLVDDQHFFIKYNAIHSLGRRGERSAEKKLLDIMKKSENWYVQLYTYKALRKLGWKQKRSI